MNPLILLDAITSASRRFLKERRGSPDEISMLRSRELLDAPDGFFDFSQRRYDEGISRDYDRILSEGVVLQEYYDMNQARERIQEVLKASDARKAKVEREQDKKCIQIYVSDGLDSTQIISYIARQMRPGLNIQLQKYIQHKLAGSTISKFLSGEGINPKEVGTIEFIFLDDFSASGAQMETRFKNLKDSLNKAEYRSRYDKNKFNIKYTFGPLFLTRGAESLLNNQEGAEVSKGYKRVGSIEHKSQGKESNQDYSSSETFVTFPWMAPNNNSYSASTLARAFTPTPRHSKVQALMETLRRLRFIYGRIKRTFTAKPTIAETIERFDRDKIDIPPVLRKILMLDDGRIPYDKLNDKEQMSLIKKLMANIPVVGNGVSEASVVEQINRILAFKQFKPENVDYYDFYEVIMREFKS